MSMLFDRLKNKVPFVMENTEKNLAVLLPLCKSLDITLVSGEPVDKVDYSLYSDFGHIVVGGLLTKGEYRLRFTTMSCKRTPVSSGCNLSLH